MAQPARFSFDTFARHPVATRRCWTIALLSFALLLIISGLLSDDWISGTTTRAQQPRAQQRRAATTTSQNATNANTTTAPATTTKRITPLRTSDSPEGSRVTITSDAPLNDYAAYRSGNRFYVVIPGADASAVKSGARGSGFEDAQVQRRGNDAVLSFRLKPGAKARVNQRFNRLDVVFDTPGETASTASNQTPANSNRTTPNPPLPTPNQSPSSTPDASVIASPENTNRNAERIANARDIAAQQRLIADRAANTAPPVTTPAPDVAMLPATGGSPEISPTPSSDQLAQAQPAPQLPSAATTTINPAATSSSSSFSTTLATVVRGNLPWFILAALGLFLGLFLFVRAARKSTAPPPALDKAQIERATQVPSDQNVVTSPKSLAAAPVAALTATLVAEPVTTTKEGELVTAKSTSGADVKEAKPKEVKEKLSPSLIPVVTGRDDSIVENEEAAMTAAPLPRAAAPVDREAVARELQNLLDGKEYSDEVLRQAADAPSRELIASELVAALSTRNLARRDQARRAYLTYGYFDDATRDLHQAETPAARVAAARALGMSANPDATPPLINALTDKTPEVRRAAIEALAALRDPRAVEPLTKLRHRENKRVIPYRIIDHAIVACTAVAVTGIATHRQPDTVSSTAAATPEALTAVVSPEDSSLKDAPSEVKFVTLAPPVKFDFIEPEKGKHVEPPAGKTIESPLDLVRQARASQQALVDSALKTPAAQTETQAEEATHAATPPLETSATPGIVEQAIKVDEPEQTSQSLTEETSELPTEETLIVASPVENAEQVDKEKTEHADTERRAEAEPDLSVSASPSLETPIVDTTSDIGHRTSDLPASPSLEATIVDAAPSEFEISDTLRPETSEDGAKVEPEIEAHTFSLAPVNEAEQETKDAGNEWLDLDYNETPATVEHAAVPPEQPASAARETPPVAMPAALDLGEQPIVKTEDTTSQVDDDVSPFALELVSVSDAAVASNELQAVADGTSNGLETIAEVDVAHAEPPPAAEPEVEDAMHIPEAVRTRLANSDARERVAGVAALGRMTSEEAVREICLAFDDRAVEVRNAAAQALHNATTDHTGAFTRALREASPARRRHIGGAIAGSGLAAHALKNLTGESRERTYESFSLLFLMAKAGEFVPLLNAIEQEPSTEIRLAVVKLLALSGQPEVLPAFRRLAVRGSLPPDVRSAVMEAVYQISNQPSNVGQRV